jgi:hypothetical protein
MGKPGQRRLPNRGSFQSGPDERRHKFTVDECRRGYRAAREGKGKCADPRVAAWVWRKVRARYRAKNANEAGVKDADQFTPCLTRRR